ncbi:ABC transporter substrate-binding protein [Cohnella fermenti]|uniref:Sugar ABC transporter substrate-binding protein n=1 Tax=Cohnella fermenti TaxID=2565925 RepID=A0A4S4BRL7_9BACL|nr:sugar ABC transporter substrate-binding protein [Cohnella fermenti]THF77091.1 sugar ABC transporter substrate-binding protein [Cohnella fermenti]
MKRTTATAIGAVLAASMILGGCGGSNDGDGQTASSAPSASGGSGKAITLQFWGGVPPESGPQEAVDNWNKLHPDIQVQYTRFVNDDAGNLKLETALLSNQDAPDVFMSYSDFNVTKRVEAGMIEPLDDLIAQVGFDVDGIIGVDNIKKFPDGHYYYLPANRNIGATLINKTALEAAGEQVPEAWTWDQFAALAKKLTTGDMKGTAMDAALNNYGEHLLAEEKPLDSYIKDDGTSNFDSPALKQGLELQKDLESSGAQLSRAEAVANKLTNQDALLTGKAAMVVSQIYMLRYIKDTTNYPHDFQIVFAPVPQLTEGGNVNIGGGMGDFMSINKNSPNKDAAIQFMDWYLKEGNMAMVPGGRIPTNKQADQAKIAEMLIGDAGDLIDQASLQAALSGDYVFPTSYNVPAPTELHQVYTEEMEKYLLGAQSIDAATAALKKRGDETIASAKK